MRLTELGPSARTALSGKSRLEVVKFMTDRGYEEIGMGATSEVLSFGKKDKVVKVFSLDIGYLAWIRFCKKNTGNPWLPVFRSDIIKVANGVNIIAVEKLAEAQKPTSLPFANLIKSVVLFYDYLSYDYSEYSKAFLKNPQGTTKITDGEFSEVFKNNDLMQAVRFLIENKDRLDMHRWNIMQRGSQLVINDPLR